MTDEELGRLEALAAAATPGPWRVDHHVSPDLEGLYVGTDVPGENETIAYYQSVADSFAEDLSPDAVRRLHADLAFIAAARTAVPALVATVRKLRALVRAGGRSASYGELADALGVSFPASAALVEGADYTAPSMDAPLPPVPEFVTLTPAGPGCQCSGCRGSALPDVPVVVGG